MRICILLFLITNLTKNCSVQCFQLVNSSDHSGVTKLDLNSPRNSGVWTATGNNETRLISVPASVPGGIYSDLEASRLLASEIYHDYNDMESKWVGRTNWSFKRSFNVDQFLLQKKKILLVCEGLDTVAVVFLNEVLIGSSKNMFVRYIFDIKSVIKPGINTIRVEFMSPVEYAKNEYDRHIKEFGYPVTPASLVPEYRGENKAQMIRKMQSSFSWDWGPSYASQGIWKDIYIEGIDSAVIRDVLIFTNLNKKIPDETNDTEWTLTAKVYFDIAKNSENGILWFGEVDQNSKIKTQIPIKLSNENAQKPIDISIIIPGSKVRLWWPNGLGDQNLYTFKVVYVSNTANETSFKTLRIGFRTIELIQDYVNPNNPDWGREFYFNVNGIKMYSKGSNSIPIHVLPEKVTREHTKWLLESAKELHSNMIRVWGGGMYESDYFYDLADELGIFIWQDFMFACAMYPATNEFLLNVVDEVNTQVKRLQSHPSLAIWAANNENEAALRGNWYQTWGNFETYKKDFIRLYVDTIMSNVSALDPSRQCLSSSPTNGIETQKEGWVASNPGDSKFGDVHHYDYYGDSWDTRHVNRRTRYASEYGFQSFPYIGTLEKIASDIKNWTWNSPMVEHRQRHPKGQEEMRKLILAHLPYPLDYNSTEAFPSMIYMAQIMQSMGQKTLTEFFRRLVDKLDEKDGTGHNMGALYWQLNDIWEGCSWASFEINGRWKMFANYIQRAFHPVLPSPFLDEHGNVIIELISDSLKDFKGTMNVRVFSLNSTVPLIDRKTEVHASYLTSKKVFELFGTDLEDVGCGYRFGKPNNKLGVPCLVYITIPNIPDNFIFLHYPTEKQDIQNPNFQLNSSVSKDGREFLITLRSEAVAPFVFLNLRNHTYGSFSDNGFVMVDSLKVLTYKSRDPLSLNEFKSQIEIMSLYNTTLVASESENPSKIVKRILEK